MPCCGERRAEFIGLIMSPWSIKAKWALTYSKVDYTYTEKPMLEWPLKLRLGISASGGGGDSDGKLTFPILITKDGQTLRQTLSMVKWSQTQTSHTPHLGGKVQGVWNDKIDEWNAKSEQLMRYGRKLAFEYGLEHDEAPIEMIKILGLPIPGDGLKLKAGRNSLTDFTKKYEEESKTTSLAETTQILDELQAHLQKQGSWGKLQETGQLQDDGPYVLDYVFSYADIVMVLGLHCLRPQDEFPLYVLKPIFGLATKDLAAQYEPLFVWAHAVLEKHYPAELRRTSLQK
eukprot:TRINITY_DN5346_c0_g1_i1.p1 TRINITY_DN5346_c0_g1~~TRINITY_DN5346_c0_g1_i1.p1  ORF type:complete len:288 (-),score=70.58 TRINITY_DN5346_c0_g1_i1:218-1081(-)